jgi:hypothetical protein
MCTYGHVFFSYVIGRSAKQYEHCVLVPLLNAEAVVCTNISVLTEVVGPVLAVLILLN